MQSNARWKILGVLSVLLLFFIVALYDQVFENVDADEILVVQSPASGELTWYTQPGIKWQGFGKVTKYQKLSSTTFDSKVMFNDNGTGQLKGQFQVELPLDDLHLTSLHTKYGSQDAIEKSLIQPTIDKVVYMTGPLMSSKESSAERKTDLIRYIVDQIEKGVYRTAQRQFRTKDELSKEERTITVAEIAMRDGLPERQEESALSEFGIKIVNFAPSELVYDEQVYAQIKRQQEITMQVQTARAQAVEAEQRTLTTEAEGKAEVMRARYAQEVVKIQAVTQAQKEFEVQKKNAERDLEVATLQAKSAEQYKRKQILEGEGEAEKKRLVMNADGALQAKLDAYVRTQQFYAQAIGQYQGNLVPQIMHRVCP